MITKILIALVALCVILIIANFITGAWEKR